MSTSSDLAWQKVDLSEYNLDNVSGAHCFEFEEIDGSAYTVDPETRSLIPRSDTDIRPKKPKAKAKKKAKPSKPKEPAKRAPEADEGDASKPKTSHGGGGFGSAPPSRDCHASGSFVCSRRVLHQFMPRSM